MKKAFTFVVAVAMTLALTAPAKNTLMFNRPQYQPHKYTCENLKKGIARLTLTVPLVYKGSVSLVESTMERDGTESWSFCDYVEIQRKDEDDPDSAVEKCVIRYAVLEEGQEIPTSYADDPGDGKKVTKTTHCCYIQKTKKSTLPIFMTICQPCIDCFPCVALNTQASDVPLPFAEEDLLQDAAAQGYFDCAARPGVITKWNLYTIEQDKDDKETTIKKRNLLDPSYDATFFTGKASTAAGFIYVGGYGDLYLTGKKSDYSFKYNEAFLDEGYMWSGDVSSKTATAYIKSLASVTGTAIVSTFNRNLNIRNCDFIWSVPQDKDLLPEVGVPASKKIQMTYKLSRDASLTKKAVTSTFTVSYDTKLKHWEDCTSPASYCEEYFLSDEEDKFDEYLTGSAYKAKKGWETNLVIYDANDDDWNQYAGYSSEDDEDDEWDD